MGQVIDDRNDEWASFVKHVIEQDIPAKKPIDELIAEALQKEYVDSTQQANPVHAN